MTKKEKEEEQEEKEEEKEEEEDVHKSMWQRVVWEVFLRGVQNSAHRFFQRRSSTI